jgi:hypothetical protein
MAASAALSTLESSNKVWLRVKDALNDGSPEAQLAFKSLKLWLATQKGNPNLRFTPLNGDAVSGLATAANGQIIGSGAVTLYAVYVKSLIGGTAPTYTVIFNDGTDVAISGLTASATLTLPSLARSTAGNPAEAIYISPKGDAYANGLRAASVTAPQGLTLDAAADSVNGFIISA